MKIQVNTSLWVGEQEWLFSSCMAEWMESEHEVEIHIDTNAPVDMGWMKGVDVHVHVHEDEEYQSYRQTWRHRQRVMDSLDAFDLFVYQEGDMRITADHVRAFLEWQPRVPSGWAIRFLLYEGDLSRPENTIMTGGGMGRTLEWQGETYLTTKDPQYWAFFMLTPEQIRRCMEVNHAFTIHLNPYGYGLPENASALPYLLGFEERVVPERDVRRFLVHHTSNKYINTAFFSLKKLAADKMRMSVQDVLGRPDGSMNFGSHSFCIQHTPDSRL